MHQLSQPMPCPTGIWCISHLCYYLAIPCCAVHLPWPSVMHQTPILAIATCSWLMHSAANEVTHCQNDLIIFLYSQNWKCSGCCWHTLYSASAITSDGWLPLFVLNASDTVLRCINLQLLFLCCLWCIRSYCSLPSLFVWCITLAHLHSATTACSWHHPGQTTMSCNTWCINQSCLGPPFHMWWIIRPLPQLMDCLASTIWITCQHWSPCCSKSCVMHYMPGEWFSRYLYTQYVLQQRTSKGINYTTILSVTSLI